MTLYEACVILGVWHIARARAEVWKLIKSVENKALEDMKTIIKSRFKAMANLYHPDHGGEHDKYIEIQKAHDIVDTASVQDFINALDSEIKLYIAYYKPGSNECLSCDKWSNVISACITTTCTGYKNDVQRKDKVNQRGNSLSDSGFFKGRSETVGYTTG